MEWGKGMKVIPDKSPSIWCKGCNIYEDRYSVAGWMSERFDKYYKWTFEDCFINKNTCKYLKKARGSLVA